MSNLFKAFPHVGGISFCVEYLLTEQSIHIRAIRLSRRDQDLKEVIKPEIADEIQGWLEYKFLNTAAS